MVRVVTVGLTVVFPAWWCFASDLGWNDNFESYAHNSPLNGSRGWSAPAGVVAQTNVIYTNGLSAKIPDGSSLTNIFGVVSPWAIVWSDLYARPIVAGAVPVIATNEAVVFYFNASSNLVIYNGTSDSWQTISNAAVNPATWTRISVFQDYRNQKWALFLNGTNMVSGIGFASTGTVSAYNSFAIGHQEFVDSGASAYLDNMWVYYSRPDGVTSNSNARLTNDREPDRMYDAWELDYFQTLARPAGRDYDDDGCTDDKEHADGTNPTNALDFLRNLPYREGFERAVAGNIGASGWHGFVPSGTGTLSVQTSTKVEYTKAMKIVGASTSSVLATLSITEPTATNVWFQFYAKPAFNDTEFSADTAATFFITNGSLRALSGSTWTDLVTGIPSNTWLGFGVHLDYSSSNWDVYISTSGVFGCAMVKANAGSALNFGTGSTRVNFTNFTVKSKNAAYVDVVAVSRAYTNCAIGLTNLLASDRLAGQINFVGMPPYNYTTGDDTLYGQLGTDLSREIVDGDRVRVFSTNAWNVYSLNGDTWVLNSGLAPQDLHINGSSGIQIDRLGGMDSVAFYPYGGTFTNIVDRTLYGTNDTTARGWNLLAWPYEPRAANSSKTWGFETNGVAGAGDRVLIYENFVYRDLYWKTNDHTWKESGSTSGYVMKPGQAFWYYRGANGTTNWPVTSIR